MSLEKHHENNVTKFYFNTRPEADAFIEGIEFVNDSALEITDKGRVKEKGKMKGAYWVKVLDHEATV